MPDETAIRKLVLAELRCAFLRAKLAQTEIEFVASSLQDDLIDPVEALRWLEHAGWGGFLSQETTLKIRQACGADVG